MAMYGGPKGGGTWSGEGDPWLHLRGLLKSMVKTRHRSLRRGTRDQLSLACLRDGGDFAAHAEEATANAHLDAPAFAAQQAQWAAPR